MNTACVIGHDDVDFDFRWAVWVKTIFVWWMLIWVAGLGVKVWEKKLEGSEEVAVGRPSDECRERTKKTWFGVT
jgi:hypothetical protein